MSVDCLPFVKIIDQLHLQYITFKNFSLNILHVVVVGKFGKLGFETKEKVTTEMEEMK